MLCNAFQHLKDKTRSEEEKQKNKNFFMRQKGGKTIFFIFAAYFTAVLLKLCSETYLGVIKMLRDGKFQFFQSIPLKYF